MNPAPSGRPSPKVLALLGLAGVVFLVRGAYRALEGSADLGLVYLAARAWSAGVSPYSVEESEALAPADFPPGLDLNGIPSPHAPGFFLLFFFYRYLDWSAVVIWNLLFSCSIFGLALWTFSARLGWSSVTRTVFVALVLLGYPLSTAVALGQPTVLCVASMLFALSARLDGRRVALVALFAALGLLLKPQLGIAFFIYLLFRRDARTFLIGGCIYGAINLVSFAVMWRDGATFESLRGALDGIRMSSATQLDPFCCVNVNQGILPLWLLACLLGAALFRFTAASRFPWQAQEESIESELGAYGVATTVTLLSVYQRPYNLLALVPLLWFVLSPSRSSSPGRSRQARIIAALLLLPALQPIPWLPFSRVIEPRLEPSILAAVFHAVFRPLHSWTLLGLLYFFALWPGLPLSSVKSKME